MNFSWATNSLEEKVRGSLLSHKKKLFPFGSEGSSPLKAEEDKELGIYFFSEARWSLVF